MKASAHERRLKAVVDKMGDEDILVMHRLLAHRVAAIRAQRLEAIQAELLRAPSAAVPALR